MRYTPGDRVVYVGRDPRLNYPERVGWKGTVHRDAGGESVSVKFDEEGYYCPFRNNIELISSPVDETEAFFV